MSITTHMDLTLRLPFQPPDAEQEAAFRDDQRLIGILPDISMSRAVQHLKKA
jgi:hypothetical protein